MIRLFAIAVLGMVCVAVGQVATPSTGPAKISAPDPAWVVTATKSIKADYAADIAGAKTNELKAALAKKVLAGGEAEKDSTGKFALLSFARDTAVGAGEFAVAFKAIDDLDAAYQIDAVEMKASEITELTRNILWNGQRRLFMQAIGPALLDAMAEDRFDQAKLLADAMNTCAAAIGDADLAKYWAARDEQVRQSTLAYKKLGAEVQTLKQSPGDAAANLAMGKFRCFVKDDWEHGLPMLVTGGDDALKAAAGADIKGASGDDPAAVASAQLAIADGWFDISENAKQPDRKSLQQRALRWYMRAAPIATGADKAKIDKRVASLAGATPILPPAKTVSTEIMGTMVSTPDVPVLENGVVVLKKNERLRTPDSVNPPVIIDIVAMTDSTNICVGYVSDMIIFGWDRDHNTLRLSGGAAGNQEKPGAGVIPANQWVDIELVVTLKTLAIDVGSKFRFGMNGDFSHLKDALKIFPNNGSVVRVKSVVVTQPG